MLPLGSVVASVDLGLYNCKSREGEGNTGAFSFGAYYDADFTMVSVIDLFASVDSTFIVAQSYVSGDVPQIHVCDAFDTGAPLTSLPLALVTCCSGDQQCMYNM